MPGTGADPTPPTGDPACVNLVLATEASCSVMRVPVVTAPREADETMAAYLAMTTLL